MSRLVNILFALVLLVALVIALDPQSRRKAIETVQRWEPTLRQFNERIVVNAPPLVGTPQPSTPVPITTVVVNDDEQIPVTGDEDSSDKPIVQVNWDALGDALREFWVKLSQIRIGFTPNNNK